jgi:hypothetical protein
MIVYSIHPFITIVAMKVLGGKISFVVVYHTGNTIHASIMSFSPPHCLGKLPVATADVQHGFDLFLYEEILKKSDVFLVVFDTATSPRAVAPDILLIHMRKNFSH